MESTIVLVEETLSNRTDLHQRWRATEPASLFSFASGALGWALPAAVGIALGERDEGRNRPVLALVGDGSIQYTIQALWTAVQHELGLTVVVPDNPCRSTGACPTCSEPVHHRPRPPGR